MAGKKRNNNIEKKLCDVMNASVEAREEKLQETVQMCIGEMRRRASAYEERTGFWGYLSDILRFEGASIFGLQIAALLVSCLGICAADQIAESLPTFIPLFGLALAPTLYRSQVHGMCEIEAATRASGAQIVLAKLILAGAADLLCLTVLLCLAVSVSGAPEQIVQMILYLIVPFLVCAVEMLRCVRICRHRSMMASAAVSLMFCAGWGLSARMFPWLYETSATGVWIGAFLVFAVFFIREVGFMIQMRKEGQMYGTIA